MRKKKYAMMVFETPKILKGFRAYISQVSVFYIIYTVKYIPKENRE